MTTLRRYFSARFALAFGAVLLVLSLIVIVIDLLLNLDEVFGSGRGLQAGTHCPCIASKSASLNSRSRHQRALDATIGSSDPAS